MQKARDELAHVNRALTVAELTASIAHELNQPLAAVAANANACERWLLGPVPDMDEAMAALSRITRDANRASQVVSRIRALLRRGVPTRAEVRMDDLMREVLALLESEARDKSVSVKAVTAEDLPPVMGDRIQLQQVVLNLALNGIEAMRFVQGPRMLQVSASKWLPDGVVVSVRDSGVGLAPDQAPRIFEAFFTTKPDGMGMGLAISRSIVEAHGGKLWAQANDGPGASFLFTLPKDGQA
jgi:C4-dicarboxylate-specific signal transduction histidine kinase